MENYKEYREIPLHEVEKYADRRGLNIETEENIREVRIEIFKNQNIKHTPGPWAPEIRSTDLTIDIISQSNKRICEVKSFDGPNFNDPTTEEADANAKLIAAAPEMLEALKDVLRILNLSPTHTNLYQRNKIEHLINKATT